RPAAIGTPRADPQTGRGGGPRGAAPTRVARFSNSLLQALRPGRTIGRAGSFRVVLPRTLSSGRVEPRNSLLLGRPRVRASAAARGGPAREHHRRGGRGGLGVDRRVDPAQRAGDAG